MKKSRNPLCLGLALALISTPGGHLSSCFAGPGNLDTSFAGTGMVRTGFGGGFAVSLAAAVQPDGKLILAGYSNPQNVDNMDFGPGGDFILARFGTNNALDPAFGNGGVVITKVTTNYIHAVSSEIKAVQLQPDGKIVVGGFSYLKTNYTDFTLVRYNTNGSVDTSFGTNGTGIVYTDFGQDSQINALTFQFGTNLIAAGCIHSNTVGNIGFALASYDTNGVLIPSFGSGGKATTPGSNYCANAAITEGDGSILAVGQGTATGDVQDDFALFHYTTNGVLDSTFSGGGKVFTRVSTAFNYGDSATAVAFQAPIPPAGQEKIVVAGNFAVDNGSGLEFFQAVLRYNIDGTLDTSFGTGGVATNAIITQNSSGQACTGLIVQGSLVQPRKITISGWGSDGTNQFYSLARLTVTGVLDTTFGTNSTGKITVNLGTNFAHVEAQANALVVQSGNFVLAGSRDLEGGESDFAAARFTSAGLIDTTFGSNSNGLVLANISDQPSAQANGVTVQPDGKIVAAGVSPGFFDPIHHLDRTQFALARYNMDGSLDTSFGSGGRLLTAVGSNDEAAALAIQPDGKIVVAGSATISTNDEFAVARYNPDGSLDTSFGNNGAATALLGIGVNQAHAVGIQPDGKILVAGGIEDATQSLHFGLARFTTNGALDTTFGTGGKVVTDFTLSSVDAAYGMGVQSDGKIATGGITAQTSGTATANFAAIRYNTNGAVDLSFGTLGKMTANVGGGTLDVGYGLAIQPDGKILLAGGAGENFVPGPFERNFPFTAFVGLVRFNTNGSLDSSFGSGGTIVSEVGTFSDFATSIALQPNGKIVVAGASSQNGDYKFFSMRYNSDGSEDGSYGSGGATVADFGTGTNEFAYAVALDPFGRAVLAGDAGGLFGVARIQGDVAVGPLLNIFLTTTNTAVVNWPFPSPGWSLQQNTDLLTGSWDTPPQTVSNDGTNNFIIVNPPVENTFYRLSGP